MTAAGGARNIRVVLESRPGSLAAFGRILGRAGVSLEGGGVFTHRGDAVANFLVDDADLARRALEAQGIGPVTIDDVVAVRLDQETPGQLGSFTGALGDAGIDIVTQYSDHDQRFIVVVPPDQRVACQRVAEAWTRTSQAD